MWLKPRETNGAEEQKNIEACVLRGELLTLPLPQFIRSPSVSLGFHLQYVSCIWKMKVKPSWS